MTRVVPLSPVRERVASPVPGRKYADGARLVSRGMRNGPGQAKGALPDTRTPP